MATNKQTQNEQFVKESLILKGVASNILAMQLPKFDNLIEMLGSFDYDLKIAPKVFESKNSVVAFFQKHKEIHFAIREFELNLAQKNGTYQPTTVFNGIMKKIALCENTISHYMLERDTNGNYLEEAIDFDKYHDRYYKIIEFLSERPNILSPNLPIFKYEDITYSIGEQRFKGEGELYEYFYKFHLDTVFVYQIIIFNNNLITLRNCRKKVMV